MKDKPRAAETKADEAAGIPNRWYRPMVIVPVIVALVLLAWGVFGTGWLL